MDALIHFLEVAGAVILFVGARLLLVLAVIVAVALVVVSALQLVRGIQWLLSRAKGEELRGGLSFRPGLLYAQGHTWVRKEKGAARVGVDDLVRHLLPFVVSVKLPKPGAALKAGDPVVTLSSGRDEAIIRAPLAGIVGAVNERLRCEPSLVKREGYTGGWLFTMQPDNDGFAGLKADAAARAWLASEGDRLQRWVETRLGTAAADGGELIDPVASHLDAAAWKALTEAFLGWTKE